MEDLFATLGGMGIEPIGEEGSSNVYALHKTILEAPPIEAGACLAERFSLPSFSLRPFWIAFALKS